ncbi:SigE family RNA polymerase sigma factor [Cryptosporangium japonicum]|uniref:SigE family RNA polymerase sigma factor n=1 Tax=Cryptosporangium japonicum TaxID=80872 RepID=A0ABP3DTV6_9ACTN
MASAEQQFDEFYRRHYAIVAAQIALFLGDRAEAEDIAQEAFCRAWNRWSQVSGYDNPAGWVHTVSHRLAISRWRRLRTALTHRLRHRSEVVPPPDPGRVDLVSALATLPDAQRRVVVLHYLADLGVDEIAAREGVPVGTVKSWLHRGRTRLATALDQREGATQ